MSANLIEIGGQAPFIILMVKRAPDSHESIDVVAPNCIQTHSLPPSLPQKVNYTQVCHHQIILSILIADEFIGFIFIHQKMWLEVWGVNTNINAGVSKNDPLVKNYY